MSDEHSRKLDDIEKRLARLERAGEKPAVPMREGRWYITRDGNGDVVANGWCACGRDICRAPDCPSHKADPLGR